MKDLAMRDENSPSIPSSPNSAAHIKIVKETELISGDASLSGLKKTQSIADDKNPITIRVAASGLDLQLLKIMWASNDLHHFICTLSEDKKFTNKSVSSINEAEQLISTSANSNVDLYFACAEFITPDNRKAENVAGAKAFWLDIDCGSDKASAGKGYENREEALGALTAFCEVCGIGDPSFVINSGNGLHVYWCLDDFLPKDKWKDYANKLKALTKKLSFLADDSRTSDITSVLRVPGTQNHKTNPPKNVTMASCSRAMIPAQNMLAAIERAYTIHCASDLPSPTTPAKSQNSVGKIPADPELLARIKSALSSLNPDCDEETWKLYRIAPLAGLARDNPKFQNELKLMAKEWSRGDYGATPSLAWTTPGQSNGATGESIFDDTWDRFLTEDFAGRATSVSSIFSDAKKQGWIDPDDFVKVESSKSGNEDALTSDKALKNIQSCFALMNFGSRVSVIDMEAHKKRVGENAAGKLNILSRSDGMLIIKRQIVKNFPDAKYETIARKFLIDPQTDTYRGVVFHPAKTPKDYLNLWLGPTVKPSFGSWETTKFFLLSVICNDDPNALGYLLSYLAHALQMPEDKPGVSIVMLGGQGTGKGTLARILQKIWSSTYLQVSNMNSVTGNFNAVLECAFIVFMDEALFVGDRRSSDALKSLTTEPVIEINEKHQPSRQINSLHRLFAATNADHWKHTDKDDRRDFVLRVSEKKKGDHPYWKELYQALDDGEVEAMVHDLLNRDLSAFNVRHKPETAELQAQKIQSLGPVEEWWHDCLQAGCVSEHDDEWPKYLSTQRAVDDVKGMTSRASYSRITPRLFLDKTKLICPGAEKVQRMIDGTRQRGLRLPSLETAKKELNSGSVAQLSGKNNLRQFPIAENGSPGNQAQHTQHKTFFWIAEKIALASFRGKNISVFAEPAEQISLFLMRSMEFTGMDPVPPLHTTSGVQKLAGFRPLPAPQTSGPSLASLPTLPQTAPPPTLPWPSPSAAPQRCPCGHSGQPRQDLAWDGLRPPTP
jgi:hypothetical protein